MSYFMLGDNYRLYKNNYYQVNAKGSGINEKILKSLLSQLSIMEDKHNKLFVYIFILTVNKNNPTNKIMTHFNKKLERHFSKYQKIIKMAFQWVREKVGDKLEHYHQVIILDGNKIQHIENIIQSMLAIWQSVGGNYIHRPPNPFYDYRRGDYETMADIIYRVSYFAKNATRGDKRIQTKNYGTSRLKL